MVASEEPNDKFRYALFVPPGTAPKLSAFHRHHAARVARHLTLASLG